MLPHNTRSNVVGKIYVSKTGREGERKPLVIVRETAEKQDG